MLLTKIYSLKKISRPQRETKELVLYNVAMRRVRAAIVRVEKKSVTYLDCVF